MRRWLMVLALWLSGMPWAMALEIEGMPIEESVVVNGTKLTLNGVGWRKRGYYKVDVTALYLTQKQTTVEGVEAAPGPKRLQLVILQEISGATASRYFLADFQAAATPAEFRQLIIEVAQVGAIYSSLPKLKKGDVVTMDIIPGKGILPALNGNVLTAPGATSPYINSDLLAKISLRMYVAGKTPAELTHNLLGQSTSMRTAQ